LEPAKGEEELMIARVAPFVFRVLLLAFGLATFVGIAGEQAPAWAQEELFVTNTAPVNSITVYNRTAVGNSGPIRALIGAATGLTAPVGLVVDTVNNELVVGNFNNHSITVYNRTASGNTAPLRTLSGAATVLDGPSGIFVDTINNELVVANASGPGGFGPSITVYSRTASGNTAPLRRLSGAATGLSSAFGVAIDPVRDELVVTDIANNSVRVYARTANGNIAPLRTLSGAATGLSSPTGIVVDRVNNELAVANLGNASITVYARTASGNTAPLRTLTGAATGLFQPLGLVVDTVNNELLAANSNAAVNSITVHNRTASGNSGTIRALIGAATGLFDPNFIAITTATPPRAEVGLNASVFHTGQTITYRAVLTPGSTPTQVDIYLGCLLPDGVTILSLVQVSPGVISIALGPSPVPFLANQTLSPLAVPFNFTFTGPEPVGTYFPFAGLAVAGSNPFTPANQLSLAVQSFQYSP
jgi:hypothetical protein